jgi:hypothetical protein
MTEPRRGKRIRLSPARRMACEIMHHTRDVPCLPVAKRFRLGAVVEARSGLAAPPSWTALFMRAYGLVARTQARLRRAFIRWPVKHLYEHPCSEAAIIVERQWEGENTVLGAKLRAPEERSLEDIDRYLRFLRETPVWEVNYFRKALRVGAYPGFLRRLLFSLSLHWSGAWRARRFGTFMISSLGAMGVEQSYALTPLTSYLTFGPIAPDGQVDVKVIYDHRVMDAGDGARVLNALEETLTTQIVAELQGMTRAAA